MRRIAIGWLAFCCLFGSLRFGVDVLTAPEPDAQLFAADDSSHKERLFGGSGYKQFRRPLYTKSDSVPLPFPNVDLFAPDFSYAGASADILAVHSEPQAARLRAPPQPLTR